jgi:UDP-3-O-[3-hydroxymyristoyl] glucosamine N-acyltransferase
VSTPLRELVERLGGSLVGDAEVSVSGIAPLDRAEPGQLSFLANPKFRAHAATTRASALILTPADSELLGDAYSGSRILADNPYAYFARAAQFFVDRAAPPARCGIHASAVVDTTARVSPRAWIGPQVVLEAGADIGDDCIIDAGSYVGKHARIGAGTRLHARVTFHAHCEIGLRGIVHSGAVIGADGFGFAPEDGRWVKIPQTGRVLIGDDVEIGANTTVDRGALEDTVIEEGVKLDNQIQIAHNCRIGAHTAMAGCVGVAGSAVIGKRCTFGGAAMVLGHLSIADDVHISSGSLVSRSITEPGQYTGFYPLSKNAEWEKTAAIVRNLSSMREKIRELEKTIEQLSQQKK